jgi:NAD(P)-dependent dehydrogenase (short-subunit alcohol dehydrogenase family)
VGVGLPACLPASLCVLQAEQFAAGGWRVIATARDPARAVHLHALSKRFPDLSILQLDVADSKSISGLAGAVRAVGVDTVDVLINNAGIISSLKDTLDNTNAAELLEKFRTNVVGVWEVTREVRPFLKKSLTPRILNISTTLGSIHGMRACFFPLCLPRSLRLARSPQRVPLIRSPSACRCGVNGAVCRTETLNDPHFTSGVVAYRVSKTALNELTAIQSREYNAEHTAATAPGAASKPVAATGAAGAAVPPITTVVALHPGFVLTEGADKILSELPEAARGPTKARGISPKQSAEGIFKLANEFGLKPNASATYVDYTGKTLAW